jgi:hypothetical protein
MTTKQHLSLLAISGILAGAIMTGSAYAKTTTDNQGPNDVGTSRTQPQKQGTMGTVTAVSGNTITMTSKGRVTKDSATATETTYTVDTSSAKIEKDGTTSTISSIVVGDTIIVEGTTSGTSITATTIQVGMNGGKNDTNFDKDSVFGTVTAVSGNTITMTSKAKDQNGTETTYTVDASSAKVTENGKDSSVSEIKVGDTIVVKGTTSGTSIVATTIQNNQGQGLETQGNGEPVISGTVTAVSGNTITITNKSGTTYTVDASSAKLTKNNVTITISGIAVKDTVIIQGTFNGTSVTATSVIDQAQANATQKKGNLFSNFFNSFRHFFGF